MQAEIRTPSGRSSRYSCYFGLRDGSGEFRLPLGVNDEVGTWTVTFEGGFPRTRTTRRLQVTEGPAPRALLSARAVVAP